MFLSDHLFRFLLFFSALLFFSLTVSAGIVVGAPGDLTAIESSTGNTILIYHRFGEGQYPTTNVAVDRFREQMVYLRDNGYTVISLQELATTLERGATPREKSVVITIDDGYLSTYTEAWPILKSFGFPFTVFIYVKGVDKRYRNFITWDQIREMKEAGVDIQDHSYSHHRLGDRPAGMNDQQYRQWIHDDLQKGAAIMTRELGVKPGFFAIPYGEYNTLVIEEAKKLGYRAIFTQDPGSVSKDTDIHTIPREPILGNDWASMAHFRMILERVDLPVAEMLPSIDPLTNTQPTEFGARILYPERYKSGTLGIYVSELGWQKGLLENGYLSIPNTEHLTRRLNRVMISGIEKESGRTAVRTWLLMKDVP
ncbi:polysaccharide deacetylase family protein [Thermodesulfobacteriota bacterium]